jgi:hypothetical protein
MVDPHSVPCTYCNDKPTLYVVDGFVSVECSCGARGPVFTQE